jgi:hypothetical protein
MDGDWAPEAAKMRWHVASEASTFFITALGTTIVFEPGHHKIVPWPFAVQLLFRHGVTISRVEDEADECCDG